MNFKLFPLLVLLLTFLSFIQAYKHKTTTYPATTLSKLNKTKPIISYSVFKVADGDTITVRNHSDNSLNRIRFL